MSRPSLVGPRSWLRLPSARIALAILAVVIFLSIFGSILAPQNPLTINANALFQGPSLHHLLGTDYLGRDVLSRLMAGTRLSVLTAFEAVGIGLVIGAPLGVATVFLGKWFDFAVNRVSDALMTLPYIFFAVAVTAALGNGLVQAMSAVGILLAPGFFRVTRAATLEFASAQYVEAAELLGATKLHVIRVHVVRKVLPTIAVTTAMAAAGALLAVSFFTFLGIGVTPPAPTWGGVLSSDLDYLSQAPWAPFIPGALIAITVGALNALADAFRDRTGPGALPLPDPVIKTHSTLTTSTPEAADARQTAA
jgi:peptide/nickel transport system permease protein